MKCCVWLDDISITLLNTFDNGNDATMNGYGYNYGTNYATSSSVANPISGFLAGSNLG